MSLLALLLAAQAALRADTVRPYVAFPEAGLDDPAAYEGRAASPSTIRLTKTLESRIR